MGGQAVPRDLPIALGRTQRLVVFGGQVRRREHRRGRRDDMPRPPAAACHPGPAAAPPPAPPDRPGRSGATAGCWRCADHPGGQSATWQVPPAPLSRHHGRPPPGPARPAHRRCRGRAPEPGPAPRPPAWFPTCSANTTPDPAAHGSRRRSPPGRRATPLAGRRPRATPRQPKPAGRHGGQCRGCASWSFLRGAGSGSCASEAPPAAAARRSRRSRPGSSQESSRPRYRVAGPAAAMTDTARSATGLPCTACRHGRT